MTNLERLVPQILDSIDLARWERQGRLLALVASRTSAGDGWAELGAQRLAELLGEGDEAARWDLELLRRLARSDRVLLRASVPRRAPLWRIAGDGPDSVLRWRHVPWRVPRSRVVDDLAVAWKAVPVAPWAVIPGQTVAPWAVGGPLGTWPPGLTRENTSPQPPTAPHKPPTAPRSLHKHPGQDFMNGFTTAYGATVESDGAARRTSSVLSFKTLPPYPPDKGSEGGRERPHTSTGQGPTPKGASWQLSDDERELIGALAQAGHVLWGEPLAELIELARSEPGACRALQSRVGSTDLRKVKAAVQAVATLREWWETSGRREAARREAVAQAVAEVERGEAANDEAQPSTASGLAPVLTLGREALARSRRPLGV